MDSHEYRIVPITLQISRAMESVSSSVIYPQISSRCWDYRNEETVLDQLQIYPDVLGYGTHDPEIPFLYDLYGMDANKSPCIRMEAEDFHMERMTYFIHAVDDTTCAIPGEPCDLTVLEQNEDGDYVGGKVETVQVDGVQWGFPHYRLLSFHDTTLTNGTFGSRYRVCGQGAPQVCSEWTDAGKHPIGVAAEERTYPSITREY